MELTHHAYYVEDSPSLFTGLENGIRSSQQFDAHDPGFYARQYEKFGIDEARELQQLASLKSTKGAILFLLSISSITTEAQQALLKLFEEPQKGTFFVVLIPPGLLIPTLRSRMLPYPQVFPRVRSLADAEEFLSCSQKERSSFIAAFLKDEDWLKDRVRDFLDSLELVLSTKIADPKVRAGLEDIQKVRSYVGDRSPALKMLLEHLAVALPKV